MMCAAQLAMLSMACLLLPVEILSMAVQEEAAHRHHHSHHKRLRRHLRHRDHSQQISGAAPPSGYAAVKLAVQGVSKGLKEATDKWELENVRCCTELETATGILEGLEAALASANAQASTSQGEIMKANKKITESENQILEAKDSLRLMEEQCKSDRKSMDKDLVLTMENLDGMDNMEMTDCSGAAALLQCQHPHSGESFLMLSHHTMKKSASQWQAPAVQRFLKDLSNSSEKPAGQSSVLLQTEEHTDPQKCTMQANPECQQIRDRYLLMTSDLEDNVNELQERQKTNENDCEKNINSVEENAKNADETLKAMQTALAEATADYNQAMEASRLKNEERQEHISSMKDQAKQCNDGKTALVSEKQGLLKVRGEMLKLNGVEVFIQDCKVSDWEPGECSKSCGGGMRLMTRSVSVAPVLDGAECPLLKAEEKCNTQKCPVNCEIGEWGGWSACSAKCGGGVYERVRDIKRHGAHGGKPCGAPQETQSCNPQSCDKNCRLGKWTQWSPCSKACDTGTTMQVRHVREAPEGSGKCAKKFGRLRFRSKSCNREACFAKKEDKDKALQCESKRDVILLIDGSASLKNAGWDATKKAAVAIVKSMGPEVNVATLLFSGPKTRKTYFKCTGQRWPHRHNGTLLGTPDMETECLVKWVQHFSLDKDTVVSDINAMAWPRGSTMTSEALAMAETELDGGRRDAEAVVVVLTDGKPMNKRKVDATVQSLRGKARLMWLAVSANAPVHLIKQWASVPWKENVLLVPNFEALSSKATVNKLVANMCPSISMV